MVAYRNLKDELLVVVGGLKGVKNRGELGSVEFHCVASVSKCSIIFDVDIASAIQIEFVAVDS